MSRSNGGPGAEPLSRAAEWAAYDALPISVRRALADAPLKFAAQDLMPFWREHGEDAALDVLARSTRIMRAQAGTSDEQ